MYRCFNARLKLENLSAKYVKNNVYIIVWLYGKCIKFSLEISQLKHLKKNSLRSIKSFLKKFRHCPILLHVSLYS